jgi:hypothetical protein
MSNTKHHGNKAKQRAFGNSWKWLQSTPAIWTKLMMIRPQRAAGRAWQKNVEKTPPAMLEDVDKPNVSKKPHIYYL